MVTAETLFQAGSVSKPVAAFAALQLVESDRLSLDTDVNALVKGWQVPAAELTKTERGATNCLSLRLALLKSATVFGQLPFPGLAWLAGRKRHPSSLERCLPFRVATS